MTARRFWVPREPLEQRPQRARFARQAGLEARCPQHHPAAVADAVPGLRRGQTRDLVGHLTRRRIRLAEDPDRLHTGGSYSRTTSSPRRALDRQWMRRNGSPGLYSRTPNSSIPEPARGADTLASSSRACGRAMNEVKRGSTRPISPFAPLRRNRKKPSGSLDSRTQLLATIGPRPSGPIVLRSCQPALGTRPVAACTSAPPMDRTTAPGPWLRRSWPTSARCPPDLLRKLELAAGRFVGAVREVIQPANRPPAGCRPNRGPR